MMQRCIFCLIIFCLSLVTNQTSSAAAVGSQPGVIQDLRGSADAQFPCPLESEDAFSSGEYAIPRGDISIFFPSCAKHKNSRFSAMGSITLPDLLTLPPTDLRLVYNPVTKQTFVRFTNSIWNRGPGVLALEGNPGPTGDQIQVFQQLFRAGESAPSGEWEVGEFVFHPHHYHWHLEEFAHYQVWSLNKQGNLDQVTAVGNKVSYCLMDIATHRVGLTRSEYAIYRNYTTCTPGIQGLSPGWMDVYEDHLAGQWVEITGISDGFYALVSTVNPDHSVLELNTDNNSGITYFELNNRVIRVVEGPPKAAIHMPQKTCHYDKNRFQKTSKHICYN